MPGWRVGLWLEQAQLCPSAGASPSLQVGLAADLAEVGWAEEPGQFLRPNSTWEHVVCESLLP